MCSSLYIGLWCECFLFFIYHIEKIQKNLFFFYFTKHFNLESSISGCVLHGSTKFCVEFFMAGSIGS
jgi:hypothetical protein